MAKKDLNNEENKENAKIEEFEFENREKPPEEDKLTEEKQKELEEAEEQEEEEEEEEQEEQAQQETKSFGMLGSVISIAWNMIATPKGYEPINEQEQEILKEVWTPVEMKYLGSLNSPELQAVVITGTILIPKYLKAKRNPQVKVEGMI